LLIYFAAISIEQQRAAKMSLIILNDDEVLLGFRANINPKKPCTLFDIQWKIGTKY
jgi:hypothetical protein